MTTEFQIPAVLAEWLRRSPLHAGVGRFVRSLVDHDYAPATLRAYVDAVAHFGRWMATQRITLRRLDERLLERFIGSHVPRCRCAGPACHVVSNLRAAGHHFIDVARRAGLVPLRRTRRARRAAAELQAFQRYLQETRGLSASTQAARLRIIADFLRWRFGARTLRPAALTATDIHRFVVASCTAGKAAPISCALRSYLRFRALRGQDVRALQAAVPTVARWPLERLPQVLDDNLIKAIEQTFDRGTPSGRRDRAMFRLMLDLGLRASEVAGLTLDDVDWRRGVVQLVGGKSRRAATLPLGPVAAKAVLAYLRKARPRIAQRALFVRLSAPFDVPITLETVRGALRRAYLRCGHPELCARTHVLRHTAASRMLRAGTPLKQIADVLRHRSLDTTTIYTKVDTVRLAAVALPWPGGSS